MTRDAKREIDTLVNQVHRPIQAIESHVDRRILVQEGVDDRAEDRLARRHRSGDREQSPGRRPLAGRDDIGLIDGTKVTMYAQWRSAEAYQAMRQDPGPLPFLKEALTIVPFEPSMYEIVRTFRPAGEMSKDSSGAATD